MCWCLSIIYSPGFQLSHTAQLSATEVHKPTSRYPKKIKIIIRRGSNPKLVR